MKKIAAHKMNNMKPVHIIISYYFVSVVIAVLLLSLPFVYQSGVEVSFIDKLFTAVSAVSVTGLTVINLTEVLTPFGMIMLIFILQLGGLGVMSIGTFFWLIFRKKIGLKERKLIMVDQNKPTLSGAVHLIKDIIKIFLLIELVGAIILSIYYLQYFPTWEEAVLNGVFASVSATTNAGFDITGYSLIPFATDYFVQLIHTVLIVLGAIGFPVLIEVKEFLFSKNVNERFRFSLFTKVTTITFLLLFILGTVIILVIEWNHAFKNMAWHQSFFTAFFQSVSTRSAGLATIDVNEFSPSTLLIMCGLMFIGASPSSVGGGIRTTTFAICILFLYHFAKGNTSIKVFERELHEDDVRKAFAVVILAFFLCFTSLVILLISEDFPLLHLLFEICSAFGTTGFSLGVTSELSSFGKIILMGMMFVGRIGVLSFLMLIGGKEKPTHFHYPKERIIIG